MFHQSHSEVFRHLAQNTESVTAVLITTHAGYSEIMNCMLVFLFDYDTDWITSGHLI